MKIGKKIKKIREEKGLSQEELYNLSGVRIATISRIENGVHEPYLATLKSLATGFGMLVKDIMEGVE